MKAMGTIHVASRQFVRPGDLLAEGEDVFNENCRTEEGGYIEVDVARGIHCVEKGHRIYAIVMGLAEIDGNKVSVIPLEGLPVLGKGDIVIGVITSVGITNWLVDIRWIYPGILPANTVIEGFNPALHDLANYLELGDYIVARIEEYERMTPPILTIKGKGLGKITEGVVIEVKPSRVPRIIGRKRSMLNILTQETGCTLVVGKNGRIWIRCGREEMVDIVINAIRKIEREAHMPSLTERIKQYITEEKRRIGL